MAVFGMPTLIEAQSVQEATALCGELGLSFLELNTNFPLHQPHLLDTKELNDLAKKYGIFYTIHLNDEMPVAEFNPDVAAGYCQAVLNTIALAKKIGAKKLNMHLAEGAHYTMPDRIVYFYDAYIDEYLAGITKFRELCEKEIGDSDITVCVENVTPFKGFQKKALEVLLKSQKFALTLDVGHNYCAGRADENWILEHKSRLQHMHLHDAKDGRKDHLALGCGEIDIPGALLLADDCDCTVVLETKTVEGLWESVRWMKEHGYIVKI